MAGPGGIDGIPLAAGRPHTVAGKEVVHAALYPQNVMLVHVLEEIASEVCRLG